MELKGVLFGFTIEGLSVVILNKMGVLGFEANDREKTLNRYKKCLSIIKSRMEEAELLNSEELYNLFGGTHFVNKEEKDIVVQMVKNNGHSVLHKQFQLGLDKMGKPIESEVYTVNLVKD